MLARLAQMHWHARARLAAVCALTLVSILSFPSTTQAAGCYGASCNGKDPEVMGCAIGARTLATTYALSDSRARVFRVELRYSSRCNARWARTTYVWDNNPVKFPIYAALGSGRITRVEKAARVVWSKMWNVRISACGGDGRILEPTDAFTQACTAAR